MSSVPYFDLSTQEGARTALTDVERLRTRISSERGTIGSQMSRYEVAAGVLKVAGANYEDARSRVMDADVAEEAVGLVRSRTLQQAATAILAQANQQNDLVLTLLR